MATWTRVGFLLFEGFEVLDLYGPMEVIGLHMNEANAPPFGGCVTIAHTAGPVTSAQGPATVAQHSFADCPPLDMLVVPGGMGTRQGVRDAALLDFIRSSQRSVRHLLSVCTGAALLAAAGVLDGRLATTNKRAFAWAVGVAGGEGVRWERSARFVRDGNVCTSAGVSAGIDAALHLVQVDFGAERAAAVAQRAEYSGCWADGGHDPFGHLAT